MKKIYYIPKTEQLTFATEDGIMERIGGGLPASPGGQPAPANRHMVGGAPWRRVID